MTRHTVGEPVFTPGCRTIRFQCPCGWRSDEIWPQHPGGGWRAICAQAQAHLDQPEEER
jgi:hypothetical protein